MTSSLLAAQKYQKAFVGVLGAFGSFGFFPFFVFFPVPGLPGLSVELPSLAPSPAMSRCVRTTSLLDTISPVATRQELQLMFRRSRKSSPGTGSHNPWSCDPYGHSLAAARHSCRAVSMSRGDAARAGDPWWCCSFRNARNAWVRGHSGGIGSRTFGVATKPTPYVPSRRSDVTLPRKLRPPPSFRTDTTVPILS